MTLLNHIICDKLYTVYMICYNFAMINGFIENKMASLSDAQKVDFVKFLIARERTNKLLTMIACSLGLASVILSCLNG